MAGCFVGWVVGGDCDDVGAVCGDRDVGSGDVHVRHSLCIHHDLGIHDGDIVDDDVDVGGWSGWFVM